MPVRFAERLTTERLRPTTFSLIEKVERLAGESLGSRQAKHTPVA
jgi:hypothetical protein